MQNKNPKIHIIGGTGKMGQWLKSFLESHNLIVTIAGRDYQEKKALIKSADIVVVSVPIAETEKVIQEVIPLMQKDSLLTDMTSVKIMPLQAMLQAKCAVLGMHPLFGPTVGSMIGQKIVFCKVKDNTHVSFLKTLFEKAGIEVVELTEEEHDYQVAYIQALTHATHLLYAKTILGQEKTILTKLQTPTFAMHALTMGRVLNQSLEMMADIQLYNPYFMPVFENLMENAEKLARTLQKGNREEFIAFFKEEQNRAKNFSGLSLFQTNKILRLVSEMPTSLPKKVTIENIPAKVKVAFLGPKGTYSNQATRAVFPQKIAKEILCGAVYEVFQKVLQEEADFGVVPAENSREGTVRSTMDYLVEFSLSVCGSFAIPIHHQLLSLEKNVTDIKSIISHPQALAQCKNWINAKLPFAKIIPTESTAATLQNVKKGIGYIASLEAGKTYKVPILAKNIEDDISNTTRFYVISKNPVVLKGIQNNKTLLFVTVYNRVGILRDILDVFARENLNLTKLESRPSQEKLWDYHFFIEVEKHSFDKTLQTALQELEGYCPVIRVLGQT